MYIPRYLSKTILNRLDLFPAVAILGARQVGKTTLAKSLQKHFKRDAVYLDLELESDLNRLEHAELFFIKDIFPYKPDNPAHHLHPTLLGRSQNRRLP